MMKTFTYFVVCNLIIAWIKADSTPSVQFMKRAYCSCICCESNPDNCIRHPSIEEDYNCIQDDCTEKFCEQLRDVKCDTSCYCEKCKDSLLYDSFECRNHAGLLPDCDCEKRNTDCGDSAEMKESLSEYRKMKEQSDCVLPCFCEKCMKDVPEKLQSECAKAGSPPSKCSCENTICPTQEDLHRFEQIMRKEKSGSQLVEKAIAESWSRDVDDKEVDAINEKLSSYISAGIIEPLTKSSLFTTKCKLQCFCDTCRYTSPELEAKCFYMIEEKVQGCPKCPDNIECPQMSPDANCKLYCFCLHCNKDKRMPNHFKDKCKDIMASSSEICPCTDKVDCSVLTQLNNLKNNAASQKPKITSEDGKPRPGKMKQKHKMWDEL